MHDVRLGVLCPRSWNCPDLGGKAELVPGELRHLFAALSGESQEFNDTSVRSVDLPGGAKNVGELIIA
jgi:hypothetical protein